MYKAVIIDDEVWTRDVIKSLGDWAGLNLSVVGEAEDGETGLALVRSVSPDVIITDVRMPRLTGIELVQQLRAMQIDTPVLMVSGYDDFEYVHSALKLGVTDYLLKPIKPKELNQQLKACVERAASARKHSEGGFMVETWLGQYHAIRERLSTALQLGRQALLSREFQALETTMTAHEGAIPGENVLIAVYYSLVLDLQRYLDSLSVKKEEIFQGQEPLFVFRQDCTVHEMLTFVEQMYRRALCGLEERKNLRSRLDIETVCGFLKDNYTNGITLEHTAAVFHVSKEDLSKAFKQEKGVGFTEYVTSLRMERALALIRDYNAPLGEVGAMVGYLDAPHFYKAFKKYFGKTPGDVKTGLKINNKENRFEGMKA